MSTKKMSSGRLSFDLIIPSLITIIISLVTTIAAAQSSFSVDATEYLNKASPFRLPSPDAYADPPEFIRSRHFIAETHRVITKDNYILTLHRIVNPLVPQNLRRLLKPVILQHGLFTSSFNFLISSDRNLDRPRFDPRDLVRVRSLHNYIPEASFSWQRMIAAWNDLTSAKIGLSLQSDKLFIDSRSNISDALGFTLANAAYDVWMPNSRGSTYSLNHTVYDYRYDWRYWDFSFHEMAMFDLPACINYILEKRQRATLSYLGHSQGNLIMFILQSYQPDFWATKVKPFIAMAPVAFVPDAYFGLVRNIINLISPVVTPRSLNEKLKGQLFPKNPSNERALDFLCIPKLTEPICDLILTVMLGNNFLRANHTITVDTIHHIPEGTSILNILHFGQMIRSNEFRTFDFGPRENMRRYGTTVNPFYKIQNINSPDIAFISGNTDVLATVKNVAITKSMLRVRLIDDYVIPDPWWGHADYMYANGAGTLANVHIMNLFDRYRMV